MKFPESKVAHFWLDGLKGLEIGAAAHNPFGLDTLNVDIHSVPPKEFWGDNVFLKEQLQLCGEVAKVDIVASGDKIPVLDSTQDFVISSHVLEHFPDPIGALVEWYRVVRNGGYIFMIVPHKERTFDKDRERTTLIDLITRHNLNRIGSLPEMPSDAHCSVWVTQDVVDLVKVLFVSGYIGGDVVEVQDRDDKVGNGMTVVIRVKK